MQQSCAQEIDVRGPFSAIDDLYHQYRNPLLSYLARLVHDHETAEDLCQETFARVIKHWSQRDPDKSVVGWIYRIATNAAYDELRRRRRCAPGDDALLLATADARLEARVGDDLMIQAALEHLSPIDRQVLVLRAYEDRKLQDIAALTSCSVSAAKSRLLRARARFRQVYEASAS